MLPRSPDNPISCPREDVLYGFFPLFIVRYRDIADRTAPEVEKCLIFRDEGPGPVQHPPGSLSLRVKNKDTGTEIHAAEFRPARMHRADAFMGFTLPEKGAGK